MTLSLSAKRAKVTPYINVGVAFPILEISPFTYPFSFRGGCGGVPYPHPPAAAALCVTMRLDAIICEYLRRWGRVVGLLRSCFLFVCCLLLVVVRV